MPVAAEAMYPGRTDPAYRFEHPDWQWPQLTPALMSPGDGVIALHSVPHTATPNLSDDPRLNLYFRIRRSRPGNPYEGPDGPDPKIGFGINDGPDRFGLRERGEVMPVYDLAEYDPWKTSAAIMCDHWSEWDGMQEVVAEARAEGLIPLQYAPADADLQAEVEAEQEVWARQFVPREMRTPRGEEEGAAARL